MEKEEKKPEIFDLETHKILEPESFCKNLKAIIDGSGNSSNFKKSAYKKIIKFVQVNGKLYVLFQVGESNFDWLGQKKHLNCELLLRFYDA